MKDLRGKRLLMLGASGHFRTVIDIAKRLGIYTVVTDYTPGAIAKQYADKSYDIDTTNVDALERMAREEQIDGVLTGFSDVNLKYARELCDRLGVPFYATQEQIDFSINKLNFKNTCRKSGVPTVKQYELDYRLLPEHLKKIEYPVMLKPADSYATKGCIVCRNEEELRGSVAHSLSFSRTNQIIVEKYMSCETTTDHLLNYLFVDGKAYLGLVADRMTLSQGERFAPLTLAHFSPGSYIEEYMRDVDEKTKEMFAAMAIRNGRAFVQTFHDDEGFCFYEMAYRLASTDYAPAREEFGVDAVEAMIRYALTGSMGVEVPEEYSPNYKMYYCELCLICTAGKIKRIDGLDEIRSDPRTILLVQMKQPGDVISVDGTQGQYLCRVHVKERSREALKQYVLEIIDKLVAYDENDVSMMLPIRKYFED